MKPIQLDLFSSSSAYCYTKDLESRYTYVSPEICDLFNNPAAKVRGKRPHEMMPAAEADAVVQSDRDVIQSGRPHWYEQHITRTLGDKKEVIHLWHIKSPNHDANNQVVGITGILIDITAYKRQEQELVDTRNQLVATLQAIPDLIFEFDHDGTFCKCHTTRPELMTSIKQKLLGRKLVDALPADAAAEISAVLQEARTRGISSGRQVLLPTGKGLRWFELSASPKPSVGDEKGRVIVLSRDVTERKQAALRLEEHESLLRAIVDNTPLEYWARDMEGRAILENTLFVEHWGSLLDRLPEETDVTPEALRLWERNNQRAYAGEVVNTEVTYKVKGEERNFLNVVAPIRMHEKIVGIVGYNQDITERKRAEEQIRNLAFYDPLTQLPNRRLMFDRLNQALVSSARRGRQGALMLIDLDNFKILNDTQGHELGDRLLQEVAQRLRSSMRQGDTAARLGGDEFVVILEDIDGTGQGAIQAEMLGNQIQRTLSQPFHLTAAVSGIDFVHRCTCSIGVTLFSGTEYTAEELLRHCDTALYQAKADGRDSVCFFDPQMQAAVTERATLENDLRSAIDQDQFELYYQVQVDAHSRPIGAEALLRWQHPHKGLVPPNAFIGVAEETGLIMPIGDWVLEAACRQLAQWSQHPTTAQLTLAVNVSARQFRTDNFTHKLHQLILDTGINPQLLKLELTESLLLENTSDVITTMVALKELGVSFSLDDFGTGYSSLAYLKQLPLDQLKIDQSFVRDILSDGNDAVIARTILVLGDSLGMQVIAEGVENWAQMDFLSSHGCLRFQGYLFGRPEPLDVLERRFFAGAPA